VKSTLGPTWDSSSVLQGRTWLFGTRDPANNEEVIHSICSALALNPVRFLKLHGKRTKNPDLFTGDWEKRRLRYISRSAELSVIRYAYAVTGRSQASHDTLGIMTAMARDFDADAHTTAELLNTYRLALENDYKALNFDIMALHTACRTLLEKIRNICMDRARSDYAAEGYSNDDGMKLVVAGILRDLLEGCVRKSPKMLLYAVQEMQNVIAEKGEEGLAKARGGDLTGEEVTDEGLTSEGLPGEGA